MLLSGDGDKGKKKGAKGYGLEAGRIELGWVGSQEKKAKVAWCGEGKEGGMGLREERARGELDRFYFIFENMFPL